MLLNALVLRHPKATLPKDFVPKEGKPSFVKEKTNLLNLPFLALFLSCRVALVSFFVIGIGW